MQKRIRRFILFLLVASTIIPVHAQKKGYSQGYIINSEGETIDGWVKDRSDGTFLDLYKRIRFKAEGALLVRKFSPDEILGYG